jgi:vacuolar-type H+-ATPase subunit H
MLLAPGTSAVDIAAAEAVLEAAIARAVELFGDPSTVHQSQMDADEGAEDRLPSWRLEQIQALKAERSEEIVADARRQAARGGTTAVPSHRELRERERTKISDESAERALRMLEKHVSMDTFAVAMKVRVV